MQHYSSFSSRRAVNPFWEKLLVFVKTQLVCFRIVNVIRPHVEALRSSQAPGLRPFYLVEKQLMLNFSCRQTQYDQGQVCCWGKPDVLSWKSVTWVPQSLRQVSSNFLMGDILAKTPDASVSTSLPSAYPMLVPLTENVLLSSWGHQGRE